LRIAAKEIMFTCTVAGNGKERAMKCKLEILGAAALGVVLGLSAAADAQTVQRHARHPAAAGRQIVVHARESWLTAGPGAVVGQYNSYALDTFAPPGVFMPHVDNTFVGVRGLERLPNNFTVPGCCLP
jgi:hypothetical protein